MVFSALESGAECLAIAQHRLVPTEWRSVAHGLRNWASNLSGLLGIDSGSSVQERGTFNAMLCHSVVDPNAAPV